MRTTILTMSLVLLAPLVLVPTASAGEWCWDHICCAAPDPVGEPGTPTYFATHTVEQGVFTTCDTFDRTMIATAYLIDCVVNGQC